MAKFTFDGGIVDRLGVGCNDETGAPEEWVNVGDSVDLSDDEAAQLRANGVLLSSGGESRAARPASNEQK